MCEAGRIRHHLKHAVVEPFTLENGLLTPTQKIRRMLVLRAHADVLATLH